MTAEEMFIRLGFTEKTTSNNFIVYECVNITTSRVIVFDKVSRRIAAKNVLGDKSITEDISVIELMAIIQQCIELGWLEEEKQETKQETNLDHYKDEILEECLENLAVVKGRPKLCNKTNCNDCDFKINLKGCHKKVRDWLKQPHIKQTYKITKFEKDLLQCYSSGHKFEIFNSLIGMKEKGYFKDIDLDLTIDEILNNCEVIK